jgi:hypothetical protein
MKTIEEFIKEIEGSKALQKEFETISDKDAAAAFLKKYDVDATVKDFADAITTEGEITDDEATAAAGGVISTAWRKYRQGETMSWARFV